MWVPPLTIIQGQDFLPTSPELNRVSPCRCGQGSSGAEQRAGKFGLRSLESGISLEAAYPHARTHRLVELEGP